MTFKEESMLTFILIIILMLFSCIYLVVKCDNLQQQIKILETEVQNLTHTYVSKQETFMFLINAEQAMALMKGICGVVMFLSLVFVAYMVFA